MIILPHWYGRATDACTVRFISCWKYLGMWTRIKYFGYEISALKSYSHYSTHTRTHVSLHYAYSSVLKPLEFVRLLVFRVIEPQQWQIAMGCSHSNDGYHICHIHIYIYIYWVYIATKSKIVWWVLEYINRNKNVFNRYEFSEQN